MPEVIVRPNTNDEYTIPFTHGWEQQFEVGRMRRLLIDVDRADAKAANLNPKSDKIELSGVDTVRLTDVQTGGETWTLVCYSAEWDANRAGFTEGGNLRQGDDKALISGLIAEVSSWTEGTINSFSGPLSFVFNHAHRHEAIRRIERNVSGELKFRDFGTVDYIDRLGTDRSGSVELSADAGTIEQEITITERGRKLDGTHIRVLGAHEGEAQLFANLVPQDDSASYENEVRYSTSRWSDGDPKDWDRWENKDVTDQDTIEEEASALGEELKESLVEAETVVPESVGLSIGDTVQVVKDDADLDRAMRVHRLTRRAGQRTDSEGSAAVTDKVLLSTRTTLRTDADDNLRDIQRFNTAFQGSSVIIQGGGGRQPVNSSLNAVESFRYPPVDFEHEAEIEVRGLPYRAYSSGAEQNTEFLTNEDDVISLASLVDVGSGQEDTWITVDSFTISGADPIAAFHFYCNLSLSSAPDEFSQETRTNIRLYNQTENEYYPGQTISNTSSIDITGGFDAPSPSPGYSLSRWEDLAGDTLQFEILSQNEDDISIDAEYAFQTAGTHTHPPDPGIIETFPNDLDANASDQLLPSNCDLLINGTTVATNIGSGAFETVVNVDGDFARDAWNDIEVTSDSLGHVAISPYIESYKQIGKR